MENNKQIERHDNKPKQYVRVSDAAKMLGYHVATLRRWDKNGKLPARRNPITNERMYYHNDIITFQQKFGIKENPLKPKLFYGTCN